MEYEPKPKILIDYALKRGIIWKFNIRQEVVDVFVINDIFLIVPKKGRFAFGKRPPVPARSLSVYVLFTCFQLSTTSLAPRGRSTRSRPALPVRALRQSLLRSIESAAPYPVVSRWCSCPRLSRVRQDFCNIFRTQTAYSHSFFRQSMCRIMSTIQYFQTFSVFDQELMAEMCFCIFLAFSVRSLPESIHPIF